MNKKQILTGCLLVSLAATAIGGTLAYFTDTDTETNTFTVGNVKIEINEIFPNNELMPGSATENALQKEVYVENTGANAAYMWIEVLIPAKLDNLGNASLNDLHFNYYDTYEDAQGNLYPCSSAAAAEKDMTGPVYVIEEEYMGTTVIDGNEYNRYLHYTVDDTAKNPGESTAALLAQVYMDNRVTQCTDEGHDNCLVKVNGDHYTDSWELVINAYGIQAAGITSIEEAIETYYDDPTIFD